MRELLKTFLLELLVKFPGISRDEEIYAENRTRIPRKTLMYILSVIFSVNFRISPTRITRVQVF